MTATIGDMSENIIFSPEILPPFSALATIDATVDLSVPATTKETIAEGRA